jgi:hypothetical protein
VRSGCAPPIDQTWQEGIPAWINDSIRGWLRHRLSDDEKAARRLFARIHYSSPVDELNEQQILDWLDGMLHITAGFYPAGSFSGRAVKSYAKELENLLREGRSVWKVSDNEDALERRQDATVTSAAHHATETARSVGRPASAIRLEEAWSAAYGLHPEPSKAFSRAILAVEAIAVPAIVPNKADATLGHVLGQLRNQGHLYELAIVDKTGAPSSVEALTVLVGLLWEGHTDRHEGNRPALPITQEAAEMAVHAAAMLVQWFSSGAIRRKATGDRRS